MEYGMQNSDVFLPEDAAQIVQQMLSRKRLLAAQALDLSMQAPQYSQPAAAVSRSQAEGTTGHTMAAEFFAEAGLTEQELALVSDAVQQVLAEHDSSALPGDLAAALASSQQQTRPSAVPVLEPQQHQQYVHQPAAVGTSTGEGYEIVLPDAGVAGLSSMSEIMAAEQELERELMQLTRLQSKKFDQPAAAPEIVSPAAHNQSSAVAAPTTPLAQQYAATSGDGISSSAGGYADEAADITADMLNAALEDPNASVDDIVGILSYVLSQNKVANASSSAGRTSAASVSDYMSQQQKLYQQQQQLPKGTGATSATSNACPAAAGTARSSAQADSSAIKSSTSASEMAARLMQQARAVHGLPNAAATAPVQSANVRIGPGSMSHDPAQQAARDSLSAWEAEGGLMFTRGRPAPIAAGTATAIPFGNTMPAASSRSRPTSPPGGRYGTAVMGRFNGSYAEKASSKAASQSRGREPQEPRLTPAEMEKSWRQGLRGQEAAQGPTVQSHGAAVEVQGFGSGADVSKFPAGFGASEAQEWLGYDTVMHAAGGQQQQQQQGAAVEALVAAKPKLTPELDAKLQQLYRRNVDWRRRCEVVYAQQKHAEVREEMKKCTFVPRINQKSAKIVQKVRSGYPVRPDTAPTASRNSAQQQKQQQQRPASVGRGRSIHTRERHERYVSEEQRIILDSKRAAHESAVRAANAVAAVLGEEAGRQLMEEMLGKELIANTTVANDPISTDGAAAAAGSSTDGADQSKLSPGSRSGSPRRAWLISDAALRLYADAFERQERAEQAVVEAEGRRTRAWSAPRCTMYRDVAPRVFEHLSPEGRTSPKKTREGSAPPECTFKPQTNCRKYPNSSKYLTKQQQSPTAKRISSSNSGNAARRLDADFASAVEQLIQQQQEHDVGLRQLLGSCRADSPRNLSPISSSRQPGGEKPTAAGNGGGAVAAIAAEVSRSQCAPRGVGGSDGLNWNEFIDRQGMFLLVKEAKAADMAAQMARTKMPQLSPGSKRILKEKQKAQSLGQSPKPTDLMTAMYNHCTQYPISMLCGSSPTAAAVAASSSPAGSSSAGSPYLDRVQQQMQGGPQGSPAGNAAQQQQQQAPEWCRHSFKPAITRKAAAMKPRSFEEMSEGDRLRREAKVEQLRIMEEARRLAGVTFSPDMSPTRSRRCLSPHSGPAPGELATSATTHNGNTIVRSPSANGSPANPGDSALSRARSPSRVYDSVKARIQLRGAGLEAYMQSLEQKRRDLEEKRRRQQEERQEKEMEECTFKPVTTPVPAYLTAMAGMGYTARFIESKMTEAAMPQHQQQQQQQQQLFEQQEQQQQQHFGSRSPQQGQRLKMMQLEQQYQELLAQQQEIMQQPRDDLMPWQVAIEQGKRHRD